MRLYLMRHGKAEERDSWGGTDEARPLTEEGRNEVERAAQGLRLLGVSLDAILSSPLARAAATARLVAEVLQAPFALTPALAPGCGLDALAPLLSARASAQAVLVVGHEPDLSLLAGQLIAGRGPAHLALKKGACCRIDLPGSVLRASTNGAERLSGSGTLAWLLSARQLGMLGGDTPSAEENV